VTAAELSGGSGCPGAGPPSVRPYRGQSFERRWRPLFRRMDAGFCFCYCSRRLAHRRPCAACAGRPGPLQQAPRRGRPGRSADGLLTVAARGVHLFPIRCSSRRSTRQRRTPTAAAPAAPLRRPHRSCNRPRPPGWSRSPGTRAPGRQPGPDEEIAAELELSRPLRRPGLRRARVLGSGRLPGTGDRSDAGVGAPGGAGAGRAQGQVFQAGALDAGGAGTAGHRGIGLAGLFSSAPGRTFCAARSRFSRPSMTAIGAARRSSAGVAAGFDRSTCGWAPRDLL